MGGGLGLLGPLEGQRQLQNTGDVEETQRKPGKGESKDRLPTFKSVERVLGGILFRLENGYAIGPDDGCVRGAVKKP